MGMEFQERLINYEMQAVITTFRNLQANAIIYAYINLLPTCFALQII